MLYIVHYAEIALKKGKRPFFERLLIKDIENRTKAKSKKLYGRILLESKEDISETLRKIPGIAYFSKVLEKSLSLEDIISAVKSIANKNLVYKIKVKRQNKSFYLKSPEIAKKIAEDLVKEGFSFDYKNYDKEIFIEICDKNAYIYDEKIKGLGGLPIGSTGKVFSLLSGGIDSPVASFLLIRRGCKLFLIHFYNKTINSRAALQKVKDLAKKLSEYQKGIKLYIVPFDDLQKDIIEKSRPELRMLVYKIMMIKISEIFAKKNNAKAISVGDNLSQVASQTLDNINTIYKFATLPILAPLIAYDKKEIIEKAKEIKTYDISIRPYEDCCSLLLAKHPATKSDYKDVEKIVASLDKEIINRAIKNTEIFKV